MGIKSYVHCLVFPFFQVLESLDLCVFRLVSPTMVNREWEPLEEYIINHLPFLTQTHLGRPSSNFTLAFFPSEENINVVMDQLYPYLGFVRLHLLADGRWHDYSDTEYILFRFDQTDYENDSVFYHSYTNGLKLSTGFVNDDVALTDEDIPHSPSDAHMISAACRAYEALPTTDKNLVKSATHRYVLAHGPDRHMDFFSRIINLVSSIECFLGLDSNAGAREFGSKLKQCFNFPELNSWGSQVYKLRSDFAHQLTAFSADQSRGEGHIEKLFFDNSQESTLHASHFRVARHVLFSLIQSRLYGVPPNSSGLRELLYCNEVPIRNIVRLFRDKKELGEPYYEQFALIRMNQVGGKLDDMKYIVKKIFECLHRHYPNEQTFMPSNIQFRDPHKLLNTMEDARKRAKKMRSEIPLEPKKMAELKFLQELYQLIWKLHIPLHTELTHANSPGN